MDGRKAVSVVHMIVVGASDNVWTIAALLLGGSVERCGHVVC